MPSDSFTLENEIILLIGTIKGTFFAGYARRVIKQTASGDIFLVVW
jgi:hypothetical protein